MSFLSSRRGASLTALGAVVAFFVLAPGKAWAPLLPPCVSPVQKYTFWQSATAGKLGAFTVGGGPTKTTSFTAAPINTISTAVSICPTNTFVPKVGTYDQWGIPFGTPNCNPPLGTPLLELTVTPAQLGCVPGTLNPGVIQNDCK